jgi:hypothetical protein
MNDLDIDKISRLEEQVELFRSLSLDERGELIMAACRAAAQIEQGRLDSGLPPSQPAPWPESTWQLLKRHAPNGQRRASE